MSDMEDSSRTTFEEDFFKFTSESKELFLNNVTFQLGQFVKNGFLKLLFDKAKLLVDMFGKYANLNNFTHFIFYSFLYFVQVVK
ncbi:hypothetical protein RirG_147370 [Rhizophagus irregularis DAOM 197198w]|uniref:Uncharacterized protein n=1 Tax=Rhizophagus irregularis (strain DAOM 197198w) TaxID=1432141 RepID=A0A015J393_RHIIW|nr:hypothetical protein RirG_147370 [Rhizophagus irregularis DAOM 197198w]